MLAQKYKDLINNQFGEFHKFACKDADSLESFSGFFGLLDKFLAMKEKMLEVLNTTISEGKKGRIRRYYENGKSCAVGRYMTAPEKLKYEDQINRFFILHHYYGMSLIKENYQDIPVLFWSLIQELNDDVNNVFWTNNPEKNEDELTEVGLRKILEIKTIFNL